MGRVGCFPITVRPSKNRIETKEGQDVLGVASDVFETLYLTDRTFAFVAPQPECTRIDSRYLACCFVRAEACDVLAVVSKPKEGDHLSMGQPEAGLLVLLGSWTRGSTR